MYYWTINLRKDFAVEKTLSTFATRSRKTGCSLKGFQDKIRCTANKDFFCFFEEKFGGNKKVSTFALR